MGNTTQVPQMYQFLKKKKKVKKEKEGEVVLYIKISRILMLHNFVARNPQIPWTHLGSFLKVRIIVNSSKIPKQFYC